MSITDKLMSKEESNSKQSHDEIYISTAKRDSKKFIPDLGYKLSQYIAQRENAEKNKHRFTKNIRHNSRFSNGSPKVHHTNGSNEITQYKKNLCDF